MGKGKHRLFNLHEQRGELIFYARNDRNRCLGRRGEGTEGTRALARMTFRERQAFRSDKERLHKAAEAEQVAVKPAHLCGHRDDCRGKGAGIRVRVQALSEACGNTAPF
jgi:hypothetical protein